MPAHMLGACPGGPRPWRGPGAAPVSLRSPSRSSECKPGRAGPRAAGPVRGCGGGRGPDAAPSPGVQRPLPWAWVLWAPEEGRPAWGSGCSICGGGKPCPGVWVLWAPEEGSPAWGLGAVGSGAGKVRAAQAPLEVLRSRSDATRSARPLFQGGLLISFMEEVSVTSNDLTKLIRLNSNYRVFSLFNYLLNWCFLINFLIKMY